ncbi:hypothetical protein PV325_010051, partial [Microctonus aethiopoides]
MITVDKAIFIWFSVTIYIISNIRKEDINGGKNNEKVDVRNKAVNDAQHISDTSVFGPRAYFRTTVSHPAVLVLDDIKRHDAAIYRCRVDFRQGQTRSVHYNLSVI